MLVRWAWEKMGGNLEPRPAQQTIRPAIAAVRNNRHWLDWRRKVTGKTTGYEDQTDLRQRSRWSVMC